MEKTTSYIEENKEKFLNELIDLLKIPSVSTDKSYKGDVLNAAEQGSYVLAHFLNGRLFAGQTRQPGQDHPGHISRRDDLRRQLNHRIHFWQG